MGALGLEVNIAPGLLLSMPHLADPNFARAVVLMIEHNDEGSFGLILNRESDLSAESFLSALDLTWQGDPSAAVWSGGPVMPSSGWVLHRLDGSVPHEDDLQRGLEEGTPIRISEDIAMSTSPAQLAQFAEAPPDDIKLLLGYSGWGPGQLASEMTRGSWLHADATFELVFQTDPEEMWEKALHSIGVNPQTVVQTRGVH